MDNFTALSASYLRFTSGTNSMHTSPRVQGIFGFALAFLYLLFEFQVKDPAGTIDHAQIA